tara:strand:+ start:2713 stop:2925 length:213 start_codon:yes stop_codon:yes gene_type:complete
MNKTLYFYASGEPVPADLTPHIKPNKQRQSGVVNRKIVFTAKRLQQLNKAADRRALARKEMPDEKITSNS